MPQRNGRRDRQTDVRSGITISRAVHASACWYAIKQAVREAFTICPRPSPPSVGAEVPRAAEPTAPADRKVAVGSHGYYVTTVTAQLPDALTPRWVKRPGHLDRGPFDLESGVRVSCDVGYLCANFSLPRPLCSRLGPDVRDRDRQTSDNIIA